MSSLSALAGFPQTPVVITTTSSQPKLMGYASPTMIPQSTSSRPFPSVPITSQPPNTNGLAQGKPLGMVTPQLPKQGQLPKGVVSPQSPQISNSKYSSANTFPIASKEVRVSSFHPFLTSLQFGLSLSSIGLEPKEMALRYHCCLDKGITPCALRH